MICKSSGSGTMGSPELTSIISTGHIFVMPPLCERACFSIFVGYIARSTQQTVGSATLIPLPQRHRSFPSPAVRQEGES